MLHVTCSALLDCQPDVKDKPKNAACHVGRPNSSFARVHFHMGCLRPLDRISIGQYLVVLAVGQVSMAADLMSREKLTPQTCDQTRTPQDLLR